MTYVVNDICSRHLTLCTTGGKDLPWKIERLQDLFYLGFPLQFLLG